MNWEAVGAIGEVVGALAVVATIMYLALQTRDNTRAIAGSSAREVYLARSEWNRTIASNPEMARIAFKAHQETMEEYSEEDWHKFMAYSIAYFDILQADYVNHDLKIGHATVRLYETAGFITKYPAWKRAFEIWA